MCQRSIHKIICTDPAKVKGKAIFMLGNCIPAGYDHIPEGYSVIWLGYDRIPEGYSVIWLGYDRFLLRYGVFRPGDGHIFIRDGYSWSWDRYARDKLKHFLKVA